MPITDHNEIHRRSIFPIFHLIEAHFQPRIILRDDCCIFRPVFGCCALQGLVEIFIFNFFVLKRKKNLFQNFGFFLSLHQNAGPVFHTQKKTFFSFSPLKTGKNIFFSENKTLDQHSGASLRNPFIC